MPFWKLLWSFWRLSFCVFIQRRVAHRNVFDGGRYSRFEAWPVGNVEKKIIIMDGMISTLYFFIVCSLVN